MKKIISTGMLLAVLTIPSVVPPVLAQDSMEDITSYAHNIEERINRGQASGKLTPNEVNELQSTFNNIRASFQSEGRGRMHEGGREQTMRSLTMLDQQVTSHLHDNENSRYQFWDASHNSWSQKWWQPGWNNPTPASNWDGGHGGHGGQWGEQWREKNKQFIADVAARKDRMQERMQRGRQSGQLTGHELQELETQYNSIEDLQRRMMSNGLNDNERNTLSQLLDNLDRNISAQMHDDDRDFGHKHHGHGWGHN